MPQRVLRERLIDLEVPAGGVGRGRVLRKTVPRRSLARAGHIEVADDPCL